MVEAPSALKEDIRRILGKYRRSFASKQFNEHEMTSDLLMEALGVTPATKALNRQYWGRELGSAWESILKAAWSRNDENHIFPQPGDPLRPCDIVGKGFAVDAKYRIGSGDSGTLQKLSRNAKTLLANQAKPILLIFRHDSLRSAVSAAKSGGWMVYEGQNTFDFVRCHLGVDLDKHLLDRGLMISE